MKRWPRLPRVVVMWACRMSERCSINEIVKNFPENRPFGELAPSGLLWLINRVVFHPRGFALAVNREDRKAVGWTLLGNGKEVWTFETGVDDAKFAEAEATLNKYREAK